MLELLKNIFTKSASDNVSQIAILEPDSYPAIKKIGVGFVNTLANNKDHSYLFKHFNAFGNKDQLHQTINELLDRKHDLVLSIGTMCTSMLKEISDQRCIDIPTVFVDVKDPIYLNLIKSYISPGGNFTGVMSFTHDYYGHLSHLLKLQPSLKKVLIINNPLQEGGLIHQEKENLIYLLNFSKIDAQTVDVFTKKDIADSLKKNIDSYKPDVIITLRDATIMSAMNEIISISHEYRVPLFTSDLESVHAGATFGSGFSEYSIGIQAALQADLILNKKSRPQEVPMIMHHEPYRVRVNKAAFEQTGLRFEQESLEWLKEHGEMV